MKYPDWLKKGDIIGCTAPSDGVKKAVNFPEIYNEIKNYVYNNLDAFKKSVNEKITQKIKEFIDNKKYIN